MFRRRSHLAVDLEPNRRDWLLLAHDGPIPRQAIMDGLISTPVGKKKPGGGANSLNARALGAAGWTAELRRYDEISRGDLRDYMRLERLCATIDKPENHALLSVLADDVGYAYRRNRAAAQTCRRQWQARVTKLAILRRRAAENGG